MKKFIIILVCAIGLFSCNSKHQQQEVTPEEKKELEKVETFKKTDQERSDSFLEAQQRKMEKSKVGE